MVLEEVLKPTFDTLKILNILDISFTKLQIELANFISYYYVCEIGLAFSLFTPFQNIEISKNIIFNRAPILSKIQQDALNFCNKFNPSLIFGDTGSGKSEIYISAIKDILNQNRQALFLMPEISLTPQMTKRLKEYFGDYLGVWHSKITLKKKKELIKKLENDEIKIIAGARSALFLPFKRLGIIIVDEENDESYKSNKTPFYNAKDLSIYLANKFDIRVILGSATPSLNSFKKIKHFRINKTYFDVKKDFIFDESKTTISNLILKEIKNTLDKKSQAIIFLPIRANFKYLVCTNCNSFITCPSCSVTLSLHKDKNLLLCHYCGYSEFLNTTCKNCGSNLIIPKKFGTSEVVEILKKEFPFANIAKFDKDEINTQKKLEKTLNEFNEKKIDILVGTQMLSKGHNYHGVELAVILGLDEYLNYPDYLARTKTLSLAIQVAGRAGRSKNAKVIIQSTQADFFKEYIQNYDKFLEDELNSINGLYPPFNKMLRIVLSSKDEKKLIFLTKNLSQKAKNLSELLGYGKSPIEKISSNFRYEILFKSQDYKKILQTANYFHKISKFYKDVKFSIVVDPLEFL